MKIASITAGAAGMFCGSCLKDNTLATALIARGHDCLLIPTYTPLKLDEPDVSRGRIFLGGVNVYLDQFSWSRYLPGFVRHAMDRPALLKFATRFAQSAEYEKLGDLAVSMLRGEDGRQKHAVAELADFLANDFQPDVVLLTNVLLSGVAPAIRKRLPNVPIIATLQGDDVFLDALAPAHRGAAIDEIRHNYRAIDGSIATSAAYADLMANYFRLPRESISVIHPGINLHGHSATKTPGDGVLTIGYFARIAPEKGLHRLVAALRQAKLPPYRLRISGWLGQRHKPYLQKALADCAGLDVQYVACPTHDDKVIFLQSLDVFSVPTVFHEPKGIYVLEAMANGVPVLQPRRGVFHEVIQQTGGGLLVEPDDDDALARGFEQLGGDEQLRRQLGEAGQSGVREHFSAEVMAQKTETVLQRFLQPVGGRS